MLDQLLGRASLKERIDELEEETERLRHRYEAESDRRADAVTAKQAAEEAQNRLEDRIAQLEGELERRDESTFEIDVRHRTTLRGDRLERVLDRLESIRAAPDGALTATVSDPDDLPAAVDETLGERAFLLDSIGPSLVCADDERLVSVALVPPVLPTVEPTWRDRFVIDREWFVPTGRYAFALVRADLFALGDYEDDRRVDFHGFESDVKSKHSKGGFSQSRFERIRDDQIEDHLDRCVESLTSRATDPLYLVGQREAVNALAAEVDPVATAMVDATGDPKPALDDAFRSFWSTELHVV